MTIENYSFREGVPIKGIAEDQLPKLIKENQGRRRRILPEGEYDLTPETWTRYGSNTSKHNLVVREDGTATYRMIPRYSDAHTVDINAGNISSPRPGGRVVEIPRDTNIAVVAGPKRGDPTFRIYEVVRYTPGQSPKQEETPLSSTRESVAENSEIITVPIRNLDEAERSVFNDAKARIETLNWRQFGPLEQAPGIVYEPFVDILMRNSGMKFPFNLVDSTSPDEKKLLDSLPLTHKKRRADQYWRVMTASVVSPREATFIRDFIYIKLPELIAGVNDLEPLHVILAFTQDPAFQRAGLRIQQYMQR